MKRSELIFSTLLIMAFLFSCSPEDGEDGAIGPQGPQGEQGMAGADGQDGEQGAQGEQGEPGTANVIYSDWIPNDFTVGGGLNQKSFTLASAAEITDLGVDLENSAVLVYARGESVFITIGQEVVPLPYNQYFGGTDIIARYTYRIDGGIIRAFGLTSDVSRNDFDLFEDYRYVIIPGGVAVGNGVGGITTKSYSIEDYKKMSYEEICDYFNIPE